MSTAQHLPLDERVARLLAADPILMADPYPTWNQLRDERPVWRHAGTVIVSRHREVRELLADNNLLYSRARTRHSQRYAEARQRFDDDEREAFDDVLDNEFRQLVRLDPPDHLRLRRTVQAPFSMKRLAEDMESAVRDRVEANLDEAAGEGGVVDFKRFAYTLPLQVLGDLLGIPLHDLDQVHAWAHKIAANKMNADSGQMAQEASTAYHGLNAYIEDLMARQRTSETPTGLVGALIEAEDAEHISHQEAIGMLALLIFAGHETTSNLLAIGVLDLLRHREQWTALCDDVALAPQAVEELLRFVTPAHFLQYVAVESRQIDDFTINEGDTIIGILASANRDPEMFVRPDELDITRPDSKNHVSLGFGPHFCLGAGLARMEGLLLFSALTQRYPRTELASESLEWGGSGSLRTPLSLPVRLGS
jgi:cytochrome P450